MPIQHGTRIAPRLKSREAREGGATQLPPLLRFALRTIAAREKRSVSWIIEEILIDWARHDPRLAALLKGEALAYKEKGQPFDVKETARASAAVDHALAVVERRIRR